MNRFFVIVASVSQVIQIQKDNVHIQQKQDQSRSQDSLHYAHLSKPKQEREELNQSV